MVEKTGWTLDYIESLPEGRLLEWFAIQDGKTHAERSIIRK
jgi:hypothetical protein